MPEEEKNDAVTSYLYLLDERVDFWRCLLGLLLKVFLGLVHILLHLLPVHLHIATVIGYLWSHMTRMSVKG
jgi:hypothetical protein